MDGEGRTGVTGREESAWMECMSASTRRQHLEKIVTRKNRDRAWGKKEARPVAKEQ